MDSITCTVDRLRPIARDVLEVTLSAANLQLLPPYTAGAHVEVHLPGGIRRAYSLTRAADPNGTRQYVLAVGLARDSRGGSRAVHEHLRVGDTLRIGGPRNLFELRDDPGPVLLVAGGIGITPLRAMAQERQRQGRAWSMVYAARSRAHAAYADELAAMGGHLRLHFDDEAGGQPLDVQQLLADVAPDTHVYCCGPAALMDRVRTCAAGHPPERLHFESFGAAPASPTGALPFVVQLARRGIHIEVAAHTSLLDALEAGGVVVPSVCREGVCGTCECAVLEGEVDHRDQILSDAEKATHQVLMACVSRARGERLVLDL